MKNASSVEKLPCSGTDIASRVKNLFSGSPVSKRKRTMSLDALSNNQAAASSPACPVLGVTLAELVQRDAQSVPYILTKIVQYIEQHGLEQIGIYRINGNVRSIEKLKASFDKVGDTNFDDEDIASVAGLLKLFLRELPDGIIPEILMTHFVGIQLSYPGEATPESLAALKHCLEFLPEPNYNVLRYLIRHLARVAEHSDQNKMTSVSLSIVFGPNLFHCGSGLEALKVQGYSNSSVCRMIQHHKVLFPRTRPRAGSDLPMKPVPYVEHVANKRKEQELKSPESSSDVGSSEQEQVGMSESHDLDVTQSERSIDEAILERSHGAFSPTTSPAHLPRDEPLPSKTAPPSSKPLPQPNDPSLEAGGEGEGAETGFHRRNAKRGLTFKPRADGTPTTNSGRVVFNRAMSEGDIISGTAHMSSAAPREEERTLRSPSPYSQNSPGASPPTSPALTPRTASIVNSVIGASIRDFLFRPGNAAQEASNSAVLKQNVYGLFLPEVNTASVRTTRKHRSTKSAPALSMEHTALPSSETAPTEISDGNVNGVVRRRKSTKGQRNRISALHGGDLTFNGAEMTFGSDMPDGVNPLGDVNVQLVSVSPEHKRDAGAANEEGVVIESRAGKVHDLVKQFDDEAESKEGSLSPVHEQEGQGRRGSEGRGRGKLKALDMFEKSGIIMGMSHPPPRAKPKVSFASASTTVSSSSHSLSNEVRGQHSSSILLSASDEEVFDARQDLSPVHELPTGGGRRREPLSTNTSDDVFFSPARPLEREQPHTERAGLSVCEEFDQIQPTTALQHLTLSRPRGPASRKKPRRFTFPLDTPPQSKTTPTNTGLSRHSQRVADSNEQADQSRITRQTRRRSKPSTQDQVADGKDNDHAHMTHPHSSNDSTPLGSPSITNRLLNGLEPRKLPQLDLTSLAPEQKQVVSSVRKGWSEGGRTRGKGEEKGVESGPSLKEVSRKIHDLKRSVREYEASFMEQHQRKPLNHEKSPIRSKLIELSKLKKTFKELKEEERLSQTAPAEVSDKHTKGTTARLLKMSEASTTDDLSPRTSTRHRSLPTPATVGVAEGGASEIQAKSQVSPLKDILNKIMSSLEARRKACDRPDKLELMDEYQIQDEKHAIQKLLLNFEKHHGRPQSHADKETMRPLYDRYRAVKRACSGGGVRERESSGTSLFPRVSATGLDSTTDTLPSVTLLQSQSAAEVPDLSKSGDALLSMETSIANKKQSERRGSEGRGKRKTSAGSKRDAKQVVWTEEELQTASLAELREQSLLLLDEKAGLRKILKEFENDFVATNGRMVTRQDRKPMEKEYNQYKTMKARLKTVETLITKKDPLKTI